MTDPLTKAQFLEFLKLKKIINKGLDKLPEEDKEKFIQIEETTIKNLEAQKSRHEKFKHDPEYLEKKRQTARRHNLKVKEAKLKEKELVNQIKAKIKAKQELNEEFDEDELIEKPLKDKIWKRRQSKKTEPSSHEDDEDEEDIEEKCPPEPYDAFVHYYGSNW